ncbi:hypothetical protein [Sulfobacillus thermosulfidooxidans]|uniref:hypothetical protein n=1 Tax=Sulfobacillus thermosulfidooxidans TaxID=28034 RepID=UPI0006B5E6F7|nr:hypothetical protein [Sulfobacillus thermosulfidooxidans]
MDTEEIWVTPRHGAELVHCSPKIVENLMAEGVLPIRLVTNPHGSQYAPMRLIPLNQLISWLHTHPNALYARSTVRTGPATRLRDVAERLRLLDDQRPWITLLLILLHWEGDSQQIHDSLDQLLPLLWDLTPVSERKIRMSLNGPLIYFSFPHIGYAQFVHDWQPQEVSMDSDSQPANTEGQYYDRYVSQREPARYPPALILRDLQSAINQLQPRWF